MLVKEFRIVMPMTLDEYKIAQLYTVAEFSKEETAGGEGLEWIENYPTNESEKVMVDGTGIVSQFTHKFHHLRSKLPKYLQLLGPKGSAKCEEISWNSYPYIKTVITNSGFMKENFNLTIESKHLADRGETENALNLDNETLSQREVIRINIGTDSVSSGDFREDRNPQTYKSTKTGRGPLGEDWLKTSDPVMCCYKVVTCKFKWFGVQARMESRILKFEERLFRNFHRQLFCLTDEWFGLTIEDIRKIEAETKDELDALRRTGEVKGMMEG